MLNIYKSKRDDKKSKKNFQEMFTYTYKFTNKDYYRLNFDNKVGTGRYGMEWNIFYLSTKDVYCTSQNIS